MELIDPERVREELGRAHGWLSLKAIAKGCGLSEGPVKRAFQGKAVRASTIQAIAERINRNAFDIARTVTEEN